MSFLSPMPSIDHARVERAITAAEQKTSGEIRVLISKETTTNAVASARAQFERMGMTATAERNGVLLYLAPKSHAFAVIGDTAIHEKCGDAFWRLLAAAMELQFKRGEFTEGLVLGIERAGALLAESFPRKPDDHDELPNAVEEL